LGVPHQATGAVIVIPAGHVRMSLIVVVFSSGRLISVTITGC
jgi:hypothetical protein